MTREIYAFQSKYKAYQVYLKYDRYRSNGRTCIELLEAKTHEPVLVATVNIDDYRLLQPNEVIIKDYSENEGVLDFMIENGIIGKPKAWISTGWVTVPVCDLLKTH